MDLLSASLFFGLVLVGLLIALAAVDRARMILPDPLNAALAIAGIVQSFVTQRPEPVDALLGCALTGGLLFAVAEGYRRWRGVEGLGLGDVKLAAAGATWTGVAGVGPMLLAATASCAVVIAWRAARGAPIDARARFPFGPYIALGVFVAWLVSRTL